MRDIQIVRADRTFLIVAALANVTMSGAWEATSLACIQAGRVVDQNDHRLAAKPASENVQPLTDLP